MMKVLSDSSSDFIGTIIFLLLIGVGIFLIVFFSIRNAKRNNRVLATSQYLKQIKEIGKKYEFKRIGVTHETKTFYLSSKRTYDNFDFRKRRIEFVQSNYSHFQNIVSNIKFNMDAFSQYKNELSNLTLTSSEGVAKMNKMSLKSYRKRELKLARKFLKVPQVDYRLRIKWEYTSPAGRNHYSNYRDSSIYEIMEICSAKPTTTKSNFEPVYVVDLNQRGSNSNMQERKYTNDDIDDVVE